MGYTIEWHNKSVLIKYEGTVNLDLLITVRGIISCHPKYNHLKCNISDFLSVTNFILTPKDIELLSTFHLIPSLSNPNLKLILVSDNNDIREKVLLYISLMKNNEWDIKLFDKLEDAKEWCNQE